MQRWARAAVLILAAYGFPAQAHHSLTGYDHARQVSVEGAVAEFQFRQPHPILIIDVDGAGARQAWRLEMDNLHELSAIGLSRDAFRPGERVIVSGAPARDGSNGLYLRRLDRPRDGLRYEQVGSTPQVNFRPKP